MVIILGDYTFDAARTAVVEKFEEVGGRDARIVHLKGVLDGMASMEALEAALDVIMQAASEQGEQTRLSLRPGRRLYVRRTEFSREIQRDTLTGTFCLILEAHEPCEEAETPVTVEWSIAQSGATKTITVLGTAPAFPVIMLTAMGTLIEPSISDGTRRITYPGTVPNGKCLVLDCAAESVLVDGIEVTPYTTGLFPQLDPGGATLRYSDHSSSSHQALASIVYRDRWW